MAHQTTDELKQEIETIEAEMYGETAPESEEAEQGQPAESGQDTPAKPEQPHQEESVEAQPEEEKDALTVAEERIANAQRRMTQATQEAADLRRKVESLENENESLKSQLEAQQSAKSDGDTQSPLDEIGEEYDMIKPVTEDLKRKDQLINELQRKIEQMSESSTDANAETQRQIHFNTIYGAHPDAQQVAESDEFQVYLANKDFEHQKSGQSDKPFPSQVIQQGSAHEIVQILNDYKAQKSSAPSQEQVIAEARQAVTPNPKQVVQPKQSPSFTREQIAAMTPQEFAENEDAIMQAMSEGRI